jgi:chromosome segregation ATPase
MEVQLPSIFARVLMEVFQENDNIRSDQFVEVQGQNGEIEITMIRTANEDWKLRMESADVRIAKLESALKQSEAASQTAERKVNDAESRFVSTSTCAEAVTAERKLVCQQLESVEAAFKKVKTTAESAEAELDKVRKRAAAAEKDLAILSEKGPGKQGTRKYRKRNKSRAAKRAKKAAWLHLRRKLVKNGRMKLSKKGMMILRKTERM